MRILLAIIIMANLAFIVWSRTLPRDSEVSEYALNQEREEIDTVSPHEEIGALSIQVEIGRQYAAMFKKHRLANKVGLWLLVTNCCVCFGSIVILTLSEPNKNPRKPGAFMDRSDK